MSEELTLPHNFTLSELVEKAHGNAREKGWYDGELNIPEKLALIHSEVSEALEEYRESGIGGVHRVERASLTGKPEGFSVELADIVIRIADLAGALDLDLERVVREKHEFNLSRSYRHGGKRA